MRRGRPMMLSRRAVLRGAGISVALPFLDIMRPAHASAQQVEPHFVAFFAPNGTDPPSWQPSPGPLNAAALPIALQDMPGYAAEGEWPAGDGYVQDVTLISDVDHQRVCSAIHSPAMSLCAHYDGGEPSVPPQPTLDQYIADAISEGTPYRSLVMSVTRDSEITQGFVSFRANKQPETAYRDPAEIFDQLFRDAAMPDANLDAIRLRRKSVLDWVRGDANRLMQRLGAADRQRVDQHLQSIFELEQQLQGTGGNACIAEEPGGGADMHTRFKHMIDLGVLAMSCGLTRVLVLQYSNSWDLEFSKYNLADGVAGWSDHFISHKLGDRDRATDLDGLPSNEAMTIANARVIQTSRFKVRRFGYLIDKMKAAATGTGNLLDESLALYTSENGDGDSHGRYNIPYMLAGHLGGFETGRAVSAGGEPTGALHASILNYFGVDTTEHGDPAAGPISGL
jgi:hypothetical protein